MCLPMAKTKITDANYFIGYETEKKIRPLFAEVPQIIEYHIIYEKTHYMPFTVKDKKLLKKIWTNLEYDKNIIANDFDKQPVNSKIYLNTKVKFFNGITNTNSYS